MTAEPVDHDTRRRIPTQARSQRRYRAILEAAANAFAELGFEATTMEGVAARAHTSIGSLYQFFPNKRAVFHEVVQRAMELSRQTMAEVLAASSRTADWRPLLHGVIDRYRDLQRHPPMQALWRNLGLYGEYAEEDAALVRELVEATTAVLGAVVPGIPAMRRAAVATVVVNAIASCMLSLSRCRPGEAHGLVEETKRMLERYLDGYSG